MIFLKPQDLENSGNEPAERVEDNIAPEESQETEMNRYLRI